MLAPVCRARFTLGRSRHAPRAFPDLTAHVIAGPLRIEDADAEVADGVATDQEHTLPGSLSECLIQAEDDLGVGFAANIKDADAGSAFR